MSAIGGDIDAAGDLDKFGDPSNARYQWIVPLLEEDLEPPQ
jgi:hypothetical protein